ncbi:MAG: MATE family efflux transporter [Lachnospiraceae bacterium]|nr:MATE family efflux transporter [Lachnospiraceae bacterium]
MIRQHSKDLTTGSLGTQILFFSIPLMISNLLQVLFNMTDIAVVGRFSGAAALGAVGSTTTLIVLFTGIQIGMGNGVNVLTAQYFGAKKEREVREMVHSSLILCVLVGLISLAAGQLLTRSLLEFLHTKSELIGGASLYLRIYFMGMPALAIYNFGNGVLSAVGDTKRPLYYLLTAGILNIVLNLIFVIVCGLGVAGVAMASIISQYLSAGLILNFLFRSDSLYALRFSALHLTKDKAARILAVGIPAGIQNAIFQTANLFIQMGVNTFDATVVAGNAAAANADALVYDVMAAFYTACSSFMGQNFGAGKKDRVLKSYLVSLAYSFGFGAVLGLTLVLFGRPFLSLFTGDPAVVEAGRNRLVVMGLSYAFSAFMDCSIAASRGLGKSLVPTVIVILGSCVFRVVWVYTIFAYFGTILSLYLLYIFSWSITAVAEIAYLRYCYRKQMALL